MTNAAKRILIIDDDKFFIRLMDMALKQSGYEVLLALQGKEAIEILKQQTVDMIIVDLMMPELDGLGFLHWLRQEAKLDTPTLVQTGMAKASTEEEVKAAGGSALIYKPVKVPQLIAKVKELEALL
ncbi:MAG: response regulator [Methylococcaceae bacterium]|nr:response regulator [Methylococcaceae bacterium]